jgi:hypothetical protein
MASNLADTALALYGNGYSVLPIVPHNLPLKGRGKAPGTDFPMVGWQDYCIERASIHTTAAWGRRMDRRGGGLGLACGFGGLVAVDIDDESLIAPLRMVLPEIVVAKVGRKGLTAFYRADKPLPSRNYSGLLDFLSGGKQTVLPPSIHPDTGRPYVWITARSLFDMALQELPLITVEHVAAMEQVLRAHGWDAPESAQPRGDAGERTILSAGGSGAASLFREVNDRALADLAAWVPALGLQRCYRAGSGFKAVAEWRASGSGRALHSRAPNLSLTSRGIRDFGDGQGYSPIDVVMRAHGISASEALDWLAPLVGVQLHDIEAAAMAERIVATYKKKKEQ